MVGWVKKLQFLVEVGAGFGVLGRSLSTAGAGFSSFFTRRPEKSSLGDKKKCNTAFSSMDGLDSDVEWRCCILRELKRFFCFCQICAVLPRGVVKYWKCPLGKVIKNPLFSRLFGFFKFKKFSSRGVIFAYSLHESDKYVIACKNKWRHYLFVLLWVQR